MTTKDEDEEEPFPMMDLVPELRHVIWAKLNFTDVAYASVTSRAVKKETERYQVPRYFLPEFKTSFDPAQGFFSKAMIESSAENTRFVSFNECVPLICRTNCRTLISALLTTIVRWKPGLLKLRPSAMHLAEGLEGSFDASCVWNNPTHLISIWLGYEHTGLTSIRRVPRVNCPYDEAIQSIRLTQQQQEADKKINSEK
jgi:hypothetical protein